jgi:ABC-2 type transport system ATP-binding protein
VRSFRLRSKAPATPYIDAVEAQAVLEVSGLTKAFGRVVAVEDLSFTVERGQVVGLLGPNGAGKTTTLRMMLGLIRADKGHSAILGEQIRPGSPILRRVGALVEGPGFVPHVSGRRNLELYWRAGGAGLASAHIEDALQLSGLGAASERKVKTYSHGMRQRLGFAQAVLGKPEFLILDEPVNGLDPQQIVEVREALLRLAAAGTTILLSSHLLAEVEQTCGFVVVLDKGRLVRAGTVAEITAGTDSAYLEVDDPYRAWELLASLPGIRSKEAVPPKGIVVHLDGAARSDLVAALVGAGIRVETVMARRNLEEAFLAMTGATPE